MTPIGYIELARLANIPEKHWAEHEFCFFIHDLMVQTLRELEMRRATDVVFKLKESEDPESLNDEMDIFDYLINTDRTDIAKRLVINQCTAALFSDFLHFVYESLIALEKRKFTISFTLLRKPFKENLILATWMAADESDFFDSIRKDPVAAFDQTHLSPNKKIRLYKGAKEVSKGMDFVDADTLYNIIYDRKLPSGFAELFDKATHLVTRNKDIKTEELNLNFIFKNPSDNDIYESCYHHIAYVLMFANFLLIELYGRMGINQKKHLQWILFVSMGAHSALFSKGRNSMVSLINRSFSDFLICPICESRIKLKKREAARFFITERIICQNCHTDSHFPLFWLLSKMDLTIE